MAKRKKTGKAMISMKQELAKYAVEESARAPAVAGNVIAVAQDKTFRFQGDSIAAPLNVVIVDFTYVNQYYDTPYVEDNPSAPACWAISRVAEDLVSDEDSPVRQNDESCSSCWANEWGSGERARSKACGNTIRLGVISADDLDSVKEADVAYLRISPVSSGFFERFRKKVTNGLKLPLFAVIAKLEFSDSHDYPVVVPLFNGTINEESIIRDLIAKREEINEELVRPFDPSTYEKSPVKRRAKAKGKKQSKAKGKKAGSKKKRKF